MVIIFFSSLFGGWGGGGWGWGGRDGSVEMGHNVLQHTANMLMKTLLIVHETFTCTSDSKNTTCFCTGPIELFLVPASAPRLV